MKLRVPTFTEFARHLSADPKEILPIGESGSYSLHYVPFEHVSLDARLVIIGITPGPNQAGLAYETASALLSRGADEHVVLREVKKVGAFGSPTMRPNLVRMLEHFRIHELLGVRDAEDLWGEHDHLLHTTSVVPHAAFKKYKPFSGTFAEILGNDLLEECFRTCLLPELRRLPTTCKYLALGPTVFDALTWCVSNGVLNDDQVLGELPHPSTSAGSQVPYFLRETPREALNPKDPVMARCDHLDRAYLRMAEAVETWRSYGKPDPVPTAEATARPEGMSIADKQPIIAAASAVDRLEYVVRRGREKGTVLTPHKHQDGTFVVSKTRYKADHVFVEDEEDLIHWVRQGFSLRMSNRESETHRSPSLISPRQLGIEVD